MKKLNTICFIIITIILNNVSQAQSDSRLYKISGKINVPGNEGWDYLIVDEPTQRLFISHGSVTQVVDIKNGGLLSTIPNTWGVHGIALANDLNKGFISNGKDNSITVFNLQTYSIVDKVKITGIMPDAILYDQFSHKVIAFNGQSNDATIIDAKTDKIAGNIKLEGKPEFSVTDGKGSVYVNIEDKNSIAVIDPITLKIKNVWDIAPGEEPTGLTLDNETHRLFSVCGNKLMVVINAENGKVITTLPIGDGCDGVSFDPERKRIYASNGEGSITVVQEQDANTFKVVETIITQKGARTITLSKKTHQLFTPTSEFVTRPATPGNPKPHSEIRPNSFVVLVVESGK